MFLILLPGAIISYLSLKSINEKAGNQRIKYQGTVNLVKDKLESELFHLETNFRNSVIDSLLLEGDIENIQSQLRRLEKKYPAIKNLLLIGNDGELSTGLVSNGLNKLKNGEADLGKYMDRYISKAEDEEFIDRNFTGAINSYRKALKIAQTHQEIAMIHSRIGRTYYKLHLYEKGISEYRKLIEFEGNSVTIGNVPVFAVALHQIAEGYRQLNAFQEHKRALLELYKMLLKNPWDLQDGGYLYYLNLTSAVIREMETSNALDSSEASTIDELRDLESSLIAQSGYILFIKENMLGRIISELKQLTSSEIKHMTYSAGLDSTFELEYFLLPPAIQQLPIIALAFQFDKDYLMQVLFPKVLSQVELGKDITVGILNEKDDLLYLQDIPEVSNYLVVENFAQLYPRWKVALYERSGKSLEQLAGREKHLYLGLFIAILLVMVIGISVLARAIIHESEISRIKSEFVSNVTHELKTPLSLIRMFGETLDSGIVTDENKRKEFYSIIRKESERLTHLINNVLDFSKIDSGNKEYNFQESDLTATIRHSLEAYKFHIRDKGFEIESKIPEEPVLANIDIDAISQAFLNLLSNAVKYSDNNKHIKVEIRQESKSVAISVQDQGVGISKEELKKIFNKFYRVSNNMAKQPGGSGLGLTLTKHIIEAHRGTIEVVSEVNKGSTFTIRIPLSGSS